MFLAAGLLKLRRPELFAVTVRAFGILPEELVMPLAVLLPLAEVAAALALALDLRGGLGAIAALLAVFVAVLLYALRMGLDIDCGCYGPGEPQAEAFSSIRTSLHRDLAMAAAVAGLYWYRRARSIRPAGWGRLLARVSARFPARCA
jgi:uncharacterized membrane protein YphA (DoxX/SURF4 family)